MAKKKAKTKPASKRKDAAVANRAPKVLKSKAKPRLKAKMDAGLEAALAAVAGRDAKGAAAALGKVKLKDKAAQGKVKDALAALKSGSLAKARVCIGQARTFLLNAE